MKDSPLEAVTKMAGNNLGAAICLCQVSDIDTKVDPQSAFGAFSAIISLDEYEIYGSDIHILFSDICNSNAARLITLTRAVQLGFISREYLKQSIKDRDRKVDVVSLYRRVKGYLEEFDSYNLAEIKL